MTREEAEEYLCCNIQHNKTVTDEEDKLPVNTENCYCDNCFYGKHKLATVIIALMDENESLLAENKALLNEIL